MTTPTDFKFSVDVKDNRSPLIRFRGVLKEWTPVTYTPEEGSGRKPSQSIKFGFIDVVVVESTEPYPFPTAELTLPYSTSSETRWAAWAASFKNLIPVEAYRDLNQPFDVLVGKTQEWFFKPARLRQPIVDEHGEPVMDASGKQKWGTQDGDAWQIVSVDGFGNTAGGVSLMDLVVDYADGKKAEDVRQWLFTDMAIKSMPGHSAAVEAEANRTLMPTLVTGGKLTLDADGVYHKVAASA